eukprot:4527770-Pyramimonas_sp.AAC.2
MAEQEKRALREIDVLTKLQGHPFCCTMYDCFYSECGAHIHLVLHKAEEDLNDMLARLQNGHLPEEAV